MKKFRVKLTLIVKLPLNIFYYKTLSTLQLIFLINYILYIGCLNFLNFNSFLLKLTKKTHIDFLCAYLINDLINEFNFLNANHREIEVNFYA